MLSDFVAVVDLLEKAAVFAAQALVVAWCVRFCQEHLIARIQMRPPRGLTAFAAEPVKALFKEVWIPEKAQKTVYVLSPVFALATALFFGFLLPFCGEKDFPSPFSAVYPLLAGIFAEYAVLAGAWASGSGFAFFGAVRMTAQALPAQAVLCFAVAPVLISAGSADISEIAEAQRNLWFVVPHFPLFVLYLVCVAALVVQSPFNSPKAARGLASGVYAEYGGMGEELFKMAETVLVTVFAVFGVYLFLGGADSFVSGGLKTAAVLFVLTLIQGALPDLKAGRAMRLGFTAALPFAAAWTLVTAAVVVFFGRGA